MGYELFKVHGRWNPLANALYAAVGGRYEGAIPESGQQEEFAANNAEMDSIRRDLGEVGIHQFYGEGKTLSVWTGTKHRRPTKREKALYLRWEECREIHRQQIQKAWNLRDAKAYRYAIENGL